MIFKVNKFYKLFVIFSTLISTPAVLILFSLELSGLTLFMVFFFYTLLLLIAVEAFFFRLRVSTNSLHCVYCNIGLSDIISIKCNILGTKIATRWKIYYLPPLERSRVFIELIKNQNKEMKKLRVQDD